MTDDLIKLLGAGISSLIGGLLVATANHWFTRRKTQAEADKLEAEAEKTRAETAKLLAELKRFSSTVQEANYNLNASKETVIYDSSAGSDLTDFKGEGARLPVEPKDRPKAAGKLRVEDGILIVERSNTAGRFEVTLLKYSYGGVVRDYLPKNDLLSGKRIFRLRCEAKVTGGSHMANLNVRARQSNDRLDTYEETLDQNEWTPITAIFRIAPNEDCYLRIDDQKVSQANSSLQIRNLVLVEKAA